MISVPELLAPLPGDSPCGGDLAYDADFKAFNVQLKGRPETQFSDAEPPNLRAAQQAALKLFRRTKDLRVTIGLALTLLQADGLPGFAQGLEVLRGLLDAYWPQVYPLLDPEDDNDPLERVNIIASLALPEGTYDDPLGFIAKLKQTPLCRSKRGANFSLAQIEAATMAAAKGGADGNGEESAASLAVIKGAFEDTPAGFLEAHLHSIDAAVASLNAVDEFLTTTVGVSRTVNFKLPLDVLSNIRKRVTGFLPDTIPAEGVEELVDTTDATTAAPAQRMAGGAIQSRDDVVRTLDAICAYYAANEPSSPVPELLGKAKALVGRSFLEILQLLAPDTTPQVRLTPPEENS